MFTYPAIPNHKNSLLKKNERVCLFDKLDGTNIAWEWSTKRGWFRQGTRKQLIDSSHMQFGYVCGDFFSEFLYENPGIEYLIQVRKPKKAVLVTELYGEGSFAGSHQEQGKLHVIDFVFDDQFLLPDELYNKKFKINSSPSIFSFNEEWSDDLIKQIQSNYFKTDEGIMVKSATRRGVYTKVKTLEYLKKIKSKFANWEQYWE